MVEVEQDHTRLPNLLLGPCWRGLIKRGAGINTHVLVVTSTRAHMQSEQQEQSLKERRGEERKGGGDRRGGEERVEEERRGGEEKLVFIKGLWF